MSRERNAAIASHTKVIFIAIILIAAVVFGTAIAKLEGAGSEQATERLEEALRRGAVTCYAAEGIYPPTVDYLAKNYGIQIDEDKYYVDYRIFASNIMPEITVIEK